MQQTGFITKNPQIKWALYESHEKEPKENLRYEISPETEDEILEHGIYLKHRIRRNIKKLQAQYRKSARISDSQKSQNYGASVRTANY